MERKLRSIQSHPVEETSALCVVISYDGLRRHQEVLSRIEWSAVCLDEGQRIRNPATEVGVGGSTI